MAHELLSEDLFGRVLPSLRKRAFFWSMLVWLPPVLAVIIGRLSGEMAPQISLFQDFAFHVRCLIAVPLLVIVEKYIFQATNSAIPNLLNHGVIQDDKAVKLEKCRRFIYRVQCSLWGEALLLIGSLIIVYTNSYIDLGADLSTWRTISTPPHAFARMWNKWIGLTIYYFFILRWIFKFSCWCSFLIRLSLIKLNLDCLHPDKMGGIAYLPKTQVLFGGFASAFSAVAAANISSTVLYEKVPLEEFYVPLVVYGGIVSCFYLGPLVVFTPHLLESKRIGKRQYSELCSKYSVLFKRRWFSEQFGESDKLLGSPDFQSLNDMMGSFGELKSMRVFAFDHKLFVALLIFIVGPMLPLFLFKIPLTEVIAILLKHIL